MKINKETIIKRIKNTYCRLKASKIEGVGVFAIRDIPARINPFEGVYEQEWKKINLKELGVLDKEALKMVDDFFVIEKDETINIPEFGFNGMDISFFVNHSKKPNLITKDGRYFYTNRKIKKGEEVTVGYDTYDYKYKE